MSDRRVLPTIQTILPNCSGLQLGSQSHTPFINSDNPYSLSLSSTYTITGTNTQGRAYTNALTNTGGHFCDPKRQVCGDANIAAGKHDETGYSRVCSCQTGRTGICILVLPEPRGPVTKSGRVVEGDVKTSSYKTRTYEKLCRKKYAIFSLRTVSQFLPLRS